MTKENIEGRNEKKKRKSFSNLIYPKTNTYYSDVSVARIFQ